MTELRRCDGDCGNTYPLDELTPDGSLLPDDPAYYCQECMDAKDREWKARGEKITAKIEHEQEDALRTKITEQFASDELRERLATGKWLFKGAKTLLNEVPIHYDRNSTWWVWNTHEHIWQERDETDILNLARWTLGLLGDTTIRHGMKLVEALRQEARARSPQELSVDEIQFGKTLYNIRTGAKRESSPLYFSTNSIPWTPGPTDATPVMDELITSWVGPDHLQSVHEILAYCAYRDYPIHRIFCFVGSGANGKTRLARIIETFVGQSNKSTTTMKQLLNSNFALYPLYKKLVCFVGETTHHRIESSDILKGLSGQDPMNFEAKGKNGFTATNYAKLIIGTNVLPTSTDTSRGWYRRWFILHFPNEYNEGEDVLARIPKEEYNALATKTIRILPELLKRGGFTNEGTIDDRKDRYVAQSNPIKQFFDEFYDRDDLNATINYSEVYLEYIAYLARNRLRRITKKEFTSILEDEGLETQRKNIRDGDSFTALWIIWGLRKKIGDTGATKQENTFVAPVAPVAHFLYSVEKSLNVYSSDLKKVATGATSATDIKLPVSFINEKTVAPVAPTSEMSSTGNEGGSKQSSSGNVAVQKPSGTVLGLFLHWLERENRQNGPISTELIKKEWPACVGELTRLSETGEVFEASPDCWQVTK